MLMLSQPTKGTHSQRQVPSHKLKVHREEESTDEGSAASDGESSSKSGSMAAKDAAPTGGAFSRSALRARGRAALAHLASATVEPEPMEFVANAACTAGAQSLQWASLPEFYPHQAAQWNWEYQWGSYGVTASDGAFAQCTSDLSEGGLQEEPAQTVMIQPTPADEPMKISLSEQHKVPANTLDSDRPAKKRPPFPTLAGKSKQLDPSIPAKKCVSAFLSDAGLLAI